MPGSPGHRRDARELGQYVACGDLPAAFAELHPTKQSDWLRLYLVAHHGGYWFDATTLLTAPLDWMSAPPAQALPSWQASTLRASPGTGATQ